jgi:3-oxoacyl-[acyl-carrier protein] reductase
MDLGIAGRRALVAAGTKGIGLAVARGLAAEGCEVAVCARTRPDPPLAGVGFFECDVADAGQLERWFETAGPPEILVTNTGGPPAGGCLDAGEEAWRSGVDSTLMSVVRMVGLAAPAMRQAGWGRVVHVTSLVAKQPHPVLAVSSTLRAGLMALTRLQATELAPYGVTVNAVLPGHTMTDRQTHLASLRAEREGTSVEEALARQAQAVPAGRLARPEEVAAAAVFLCSQPASYITGVNLLVDGGAVSGLG